MVHVMGEKRVTFRWLTATAAKVALTASSVLGGILSFPNSTSADQAHSMSDATIASICGRNIAWSSLGLSMPTSVSRLDGVAAAIFATASRYSVCLVFGPSGTAGNQPVRYLGITNPDLAISNTI